MPVYCAYSVHVKEYQMVKTSGALRYCVSHNHIVVLGHETPTMIIIITFLACQCVCSQLLCWLRLCIACGTYPHNMNSGIRVCATRD